jgi:cytochrome c-type biogenesis protein CcmE
MKPRHRRLLLIGLAVLALAGAVGLVLNAFQSNMVFFYSPSQVAAGEAPAAQSFRLGGMVEEGSIERNNGNLTVRFVVTDMVHRVPVSYTGLLPDLFMEGKGVVTQGRLGADGKFVAEQVLAKHDENYMPPEAALAMKRAKENAQPKTKP